MKNSGYFIAIFLLAACKKPYTPPAINTNVNYLVAEGIINTGADSTIIKLSRTVTVATANTYNPELNAQVTVENNQNGIFSLKQMGNGLYACPPLNLDTVHQYRLRIKTTDGQEYLSDFVQAKVSPPIDSIIYQFTGSAENIYAYTHDATNNTRYYRWEYQETYLFISPVPTNYIYKNYEIRSVTPADQITTCYVSDTSSTIILSSTANLSKDIILKKPITQVPITLDKLRIRYSILVRQYALTADTYNYYNRLKQNTEEIGTIFDTQPSGNLTNIHCLTNVNAIVVGWVSAGTVAQTRIFIDRNSVPVQFVGVDYSYCGTASLVVGPGAAALPYIITAGFEIPIDSISVANGGTLIYSSPQCADCTLRGSNQKPAFWQ
jgi:hypothetical protein